MSLSFVRLASFRMSSSVNEITPVDTPRHGEALQLYDYWHDVRARHGDFRLGRDIPARPIAQLLKNIAINEPVRNGTDMRIRLAGSAVRRRFDGRLDGLLLSEVFGPEEFEFNLKDSNRVLATGVPSIFDSALKGYAVEELHAEIMLLPIVDRDGTSPLLLVGIFYFE
jgi:hypothetical protein